MSKNPNSENGNGPKGHETKARKNHSSHENKQKGHETKARNSHSFTGAK